MPLDECPQELRQELDTLAAAAAADAVADGDADIVFSGALSVARAAPDSGTPFTIQPAALNGGSNYNMLSDRNPPCAPFTHEIWVQTRDYLYQIGILGKGDDTHPLSRAFNAGNSVFLYV